MMFNSPYMRFMAEAEGVESIASTRQTHINAAINDFVSLARRGEDINQCKSQVFNRHNLSESSLSSRECKYIKREVMKRV